ncbi:MAG: fumarylacetoacetate hydrolase family protein [Blastomonas sp.]|nr:fumarylacetoacetate hydrolase family protein [Blastomonas sp.]
MTAHLPEDWREATLLGRYQSAFGPSPMLVRNGIAFDMSSLAPTVSHLVEAAITDGGEYLGPLDELDLELLAPVDLQCIKACGVTFAVSALERVIEERAGGDLSRAAQIRGGLASRIGADLADVEPGSDTAAALKAVLIADGLWSQYLEVAIGPDAEVFTKAPVLAAVGHGAKVGVRSDSSWNNPEPEIALLCNSKGMAVGATLGNDVNLRDIEGRSALLLGKAKDNNASCSLGPFVRLFDETFGIDDVRQADVGLQIIGEDGFELEGSSSMHLITRDPLDLVAQTFGMHHCYPDGFVLLTGTMFAPTKDRDIPGQGFTHKPGDVVRISSPRLGMLENQVTFSEEAPRWNMGIGALMTNLAQRGLLA